MQSTNDLPESKPETFSLTGSTEQPTTHQSTAPSSSFPHKHVWVPRWTAILGVLAIGVLYALLPDHLRIGPNWVVLALEVVLLLPLLFSWLTNRALRHITIRLLSLTLLAVVTLGLAIGIALLIDTLPSVKQGDVLLRSAGLLWGLNVLVFAFWYWEIDGGGPHKRFHTGHQAADFMFPQQAGGNDGGWAPHFIDYLFLAFTASTALSPTDTYPLTRQAKLLMMIEAILSLTIIILLAARAVNILS